MSPPNDTTKSLITESDSESTPLLYNASGSGSSAPAYAYAPSQAPISNTTTPYSYPLYPGHVHIKRRVNLKESACRWLTNVFWGGFSLFVLSCMYIIVMHSLRGPLRYYEYPIPNDVDLDRCVSAWSGQSNNAGSFYPYSSSASFDFPLPSKTLLLFSKGGHSNGQLKVTHSSEVTEQVRVAVTVKYHKASVRDAAKVCLIERYKGESGVGIFAPSPQRHYYSAAELLFFDVELTLPLTELKSGGYIKGLSTDVNNFSQDLDSLSDVHFGDISLVGTNGKIQAEILMAETATLVNSNAGVEITALVARSARVSTSNGHISGGYGVSDSLDLHASNGSINVAVHVNGSDNKMPKTLVMHTSNGALHCVVNLDTAYEKPGAFHIEAQTSNAALNAQIASAPLDSVLTVEAKTSNHQAVLSLPSMYEGSFSVSTSNAPVTVERANPHEQDPACDSEPDEKCDSRSRMIERSTVVKRRSVAGAVYWDKRNADRGGATLMTSDGPATLYV
ncbi:hypothetical protein MVEN_02173700 [Mycena venus]|uniref:DUF7330 domain-containing protein n=1 Tax=Mycena venus TaxID=2733690 RepID=A0A8H6X944_9AGAR|nr:hypothetical protein MVEN_02173700 [Mycena venus]